MSRIHIQAETPKYADAMLPARCVAKTPQGIYTFVLWKSYIDHRDGGVVYYATALGRHTMLPEKDIKEGSVESIKES